jgi:NADH-quinone oxidoreductase subunit N
MLAVVMLIAGFAFKMAVVPLHVYAGDVYQGAATPVTAFLSFVPKTSGFVALIKLLYAVGGANWALPPQIARLLWVMAALTMTFGNVLGLLQYNLKRLLAYSSIAHSGYMLAGIAALVGAYHTVPEGNRAEVQHDALMGVIFYLTAYGIMNAAAFGVLMLLPSRDGRAGAAAETFEDIAGQGRRHVGLGLCMAIACFSLIGIPLTVGFLGKVLLIKPAWEAHNNWLVILIVINAAISAGYYLRIVGTMFLRDLPADSLSEPQIQPARSLPISLALGASVLGTVLLGTVLPLTNVFTTSAVLATRIDDGQGPAPIKAGTDLRAQAH